MGANIIYLTPPTISNAHIKEKITCIRGHRERIFDLSITYEHGKLICHNFGQGGAGWTFLFGCVNESIRHFEHQLEASNLFKDKPIAVIGAGCYGLLTAIELVRKGYTVRIIAKERADIPSYKAAGFFFPGGHKRATPQEHAIYNAIGIESYRTYLSIIAGTHPFLKSGPKIIPGYYEPEIDPGFIPYIKEKLMEPGKETLINFGGTASYPAITYNQVYINPGQLMQELEQAVTDLKIPITQQEIATFQEVQEPIIFNCSGLGAKQLVHDNRIIPVQGHLITLAHQPPIDQLQYVINYKVSSIEPSGKKRNDFIYFAPKQEGILGITFLRGKRSAEPNEHEFDRIIERSAQFFSQKKKHV